MLVIKNLKDVPQYLHQLAQWHHQEWLHLNPGLSLEQRIEKMQTYLNEDAIPQTFVALNETADQITLLGSAAVIDSDMDTKPEFTPWLASVYVDEKQRRQGIGATLVKAIMQYVQGLDFSDMYLFTPDQALFYESLGWQVLEQTEYRDENVTVMKFSWEGC